MKEFISAGWSEDTPVVVVYKATWPDEKIVRTTVKDLDDAMRTNGIRKQAMILAGWALDPTFMTKIIDQNFMIKHLPMAFEEE